MPDAEPASDMSFAAYVELAQTLERGKIDCLLLPDPAAAAGWHGSAAQDPNAEAMPSVVRLEPLQLMAGLAMSTQHIGLVPTCATAVNAPYHVARRLATLDHISAGRAGWLLAASLSAEGAEHFGLDPARLHAERFDRAAEFYDVCVGLWDSWDPDAILRNKHTGQYFDPGKVRALNHKGRFFSVRGPLNAAQCPQGRPVTFCAEVVNDAERDLAVRAGDVAITAMGSPDELQELADTLKRGLPTQHRKPNDLKIMPAFVPVTGRTDAEARALFDCMERLVPSDAERWTAGLPGGSDPRVIHGSPATIADVMQDSFEKGAADGFTLIFPYVKKPISDFVELVIPELQRRGIFRSTYEGLTLRECLGLRTPAADVAPKRRNDGANAQTS